MLHHTCLLLLSTPFSQLFPLFDVPAVAWIIYFSFKTQETFFLLFSTAARRLVTFSPVLTLRLLHDANIVSNTFNGLTVYVSGSIDFLALSLLRMLPLEGIIVFDISLMSPLLSTLKLSTGYYTLNYKPLLPLSRA